MVKPVLEHGTMLVTPERPFVDPGTVGRVALLASLGVGNHMNWVKLARSFGETLDVITAGWVDQDLKVRYSPRTSQPKLAKNLRGLTIQRGAAVGLPQARVVKP